MYQSLRYRSLKPNIKKFDEVYNVFYLYQSIFCNMYTVKRRNLEAGNLALESRVSQFASGFQTTGCLDFVCHLKSRLAGIRTTTTYLKSGPVWISAHPCS